jgi:hypothetical protein
MFGELIRHEKEKQTMGEATACCGTGHTTPSHPGQVPPFWAQTTQSSNAQLDCNGQGSGPFLGEQATLAEMAVGDNGQWVLDLPRLGLGSINVISHFIDRFPPLCT